VTRWIPVVALLVLAAKADGQLVDRCFDAELGAWSPIEGTHVGDGDPVGPPSEGPDSVSYAFPPRVLLTGEAPVRDGRSRAYRLDVPPGALEVPKPHRSWWLDGDTLSIRLADGLTGTDAALLRSNDGWVGSLRNRSDMLGTQLYARPIVLREADCDTDPPVPASSDAPAPRSVPAGTGPGLELARPVPPDYSTRPVRSFLLVSGLEPAGVWAGSDSVFVRVNSDGLVSDIEIRYPEGFDPGPLGVELVEEFGSGRDDAPWLAWRNRTTRALLQVGRRARVLLTDPRMRY